MKRGKIIYNENFLDWCVANIFVTLVYVILAVPTLSVSLFYLCYYQVKYFLTRLVIEIEN